jgi:hypothetical protein
MQRQRNRTAPRAHSARSSIYGSVFYGHARKYSCRNRPPRTYREPDVMKPTPQQRIWMYEAMLKSQLFEKIEPV